MWFRVVMRVVFSCKPEPYNPIQKACGEAMKVFDRELDNLEENIIYLALAFFVSTSIVVFFGRVIPFVALVFSFGASLSFLGCLLAILLLCLRGVGSPIYLRLANPERNRLQGLSIDRERPQGRGQNR
jgi:hypothetical protein